MNGTLDKIQDLIREHTNGKAGTASPFISFEDFAIEVQNSWTSMLFSNTGNQAIARYSSYQLRELNKCLLSLNSDVTTCSDGRGYSTTTSAGIAENLFLLFDFFFEAFGDYLTETLICPPAYHFYVCTSTNNDRNIIQGWLDKISVNEGIREIIKSYLKRLNDYPNYRFQYAELAYYQKFICELKSLTLLKPGGDWTPLLVEELLKLNFNHLDLFNFQKHKIRAKFEKLDLQTAIAIIRQELPQIPYQEKRNKLKLDYRWAQTGEMLYNWLSEELSFLEGRLEAESKTLQNLQKLPFRLSVAHLACLIRLFAKEHIFGEIPLKEIFDFFGRNCSSKRQSVISAGGISKEFYSMSQVVAAEMRDILQRMINRINRDYFPAVVVMLLTAGFC